MTPICQVCHQEQLDIVEFMNTAGVVAYVCDYCDAMNPLSDLVIAPEPTAQAEAREYRVE